ncbi:hydroxymethylglutaryl-CoA synthase [Nocardia sp. NPDC020380]|uniref:hydroxymethylglutaryl-CoA synthase n=1 Tax=Nocardia sp. NPDC020380 TaxID=3364309 RepID=UPI0037BD2E8D
MNPIAVGIHDLSLAATHYFLDLAVLAERSGVDVDKYYLGLGQELMSVPAADEDIVTMAAAAAQPILERHGTEGLRTVLFATESGVDQSKAAGLFLHPLLGLPHDCRVVELKQACYGGTAALQFAAALVARDPQQRVLVIASDIAKYQPDSPGEPTQGAAAVAMLVTADPAILALDAVSGIYSEDIMDFWRPNHRTTALVDGKLSIEAYLRASLGAWEDYRRRGGLALTEFAAFCYHQPFTKMAYKAHRNLLQANGFNPSSADLDAALLATTTYNRLLGNSYTASVYVALAALLDSTTDLTARPIAFLSYGSGNVAEFFSGRVVSGYRDQLRTVANAEMLAHRKPITFDRYRELPDALRAAVGNLVSPRESEGAFRIAAIRDDKRIYEVVLH